MAVMLKKVSNMTISRFMYMCVHVFSSKRMRRKCALFNNLKIVLIQMQPRWIIWHLPNHVPSSSERHRNVFGQGLAFDLQGCIDP